MENSLEITIDSGDEIGTKLLITQEKQITSHTAQSVMRILQGKKTEDQIFQEKIKKLFEHKLLQTENAKIFGDYRTESTQGAYANDRFKRKQQSYYQKYQNVVLDIVKKRLLIASKDTNISGDTFQKIVGNTLGDVMDGICIFGGELTPDLFKGVLLNPHNDIKKQQNIIVQKYHSLSDIRYGKNEDQILSNKETKEPQVLKMYKKFLAEGVINNGEISEERLSQKIEEHFDEHFIQMYEAFGLWHKSTGLDVEFLQHLYRVFQRIFQDIKILQDNGIAFTRSNILKNFESHIQNKIGGDYVDSIKDPDKKTIHESQLAEFSNFVAKVCKKQMGVLKHFPKKVFKKRAQYLESFHKVYKTDKECDDVKLDSVHFSDWYSMKPSRRRKAFFEQFIRINEEGNADIFDRYKELIPDPFQTGNEDQMQRFTSFLEKPFKQQESSLRGTSKPDKMHNYRLDTLSQFQEIKQKIDRFDTENLEQEKIAFLRENKNDIDLLVGFWWYNLEQDFIEENSQYQGEEGREKFETDYPQHGMIEAIVSDLFEKNHVGRNKKSDVQIFVNGGVRNSSAWNKEYTLKQLDHSYTKKIVDISKMNIENKGTKMNFTNMLDVYLSSTNCNSHKKILDHISIGLQTCNALIEGNKSNINLNYLKVLKRHGFDLEDMLQISQLKTFLKYIMGSSSAIETMMDDAEKDRDFFEKITGSETFEGFFGKKGSGKWKIGPKKKWGRVYQKWIHKYQGDLSEMGDLTRMLFVSENPLDFTDNISNFIEYVQDLPEVEQIDIEDYVGNLTEKAQKPSGYRDANLKIKLKSGNTVEVQFHFKEFLKFKTKGYVLGEDFLQPEYIDKAHIQRFTPEEVISIQEVCKQDDSIILPANFGVLCKDGKFSFAGGIQKNTNKLLSSDCLYNLARSFRHDEELESKIQKFESVGYDIAGGRTLAM